MTFRTDLSEAQSFIDRAQQINAKAEIARLAKIKAINSAITLILTIAAIGIFFAVAEKQQAYQDRDRQEITSWTK